MKADPGAELTCRARNFKVGDRDRGVLSFYAVQSLPSADTMDSWLSLTQDAIAEGGGKGLLKQFETPSLQLLGHRVPGTPAKLHEAAAEHGAQGHEPGS
jgi:hypothetical protein